MADRIRLQVLVPVNRSLASRAGPIGFRAFISGEVCRDHEGCDRQASPFQARTPSRRSFGIGCAFVVRIPFVLGTGSFRMSSSALPASLAPAPPWTPIPPPQGICGLPCAFPGFLKPQCQDTCSISIGHQFECRCAVHDADAFAPPRTLPLRGKNFRELLLFLRPQHAIAVALPLKRAGLRSPEDLCRANSEQIIALGLPAAVIRSAGRDPFALPKLLYPVGPCSSTAEPPSG